MNELTTPEQWWMNYRQLVMSPKCGAVQIVETRRAFAAGMFAVMKMMKELGESQDEDGSMMKLEKFNKQLEQMIRNVTAEEPTE